MNPYDQATPGNDYIDLRDVLDEARRIKRAIRDAAAVLDADEIAENEADPRGDDRCANGCVCTVTEKIDAEAYDRFADLAEAVDGWDAMFDAAGLSDDEIDYLRDVGALEADLGMPLEQAAEQEPTLINDRIFTVYARQLAEDIGAVDDNTRWPCSYIDWEAAADALKIDYSVVTFGGDLYLWRQ